MIVVEGQINLGMPGLPFSAMPKAFEYKSMTHPELYRRNVEFFVALTSTEIGRL